VRAVVLTDGLVFVRGVTLMCSLVLGLRACLETGATWMTSPAFIRGGHPLPTCPLVPRPTFTLHAPEMSSLLGASCAIGFFTIVYEVRRMTRLPGIVHVLSDHLVLAVTRAPALVLSM